MNSDYPKKILDFLTMNAPERQVVRLSLVLFVLGLVMRFLPWGLPSIETFQVGDALVVSSNVEYAPEIADTLNKVTASSPLEKVRSARPKKIKKAAKTVKLPVRVNTATAEELCALKGVGPKLADKIIAVREASGPFKTAADLQKVPGIGKKKLESLLSGVIFD